MNAPVSFDLAPATTTTAWKVSRYGGPDTLRPVERPLRPLGPDDVQVAIAASGVTRADTMMRAGQPRFARLFLGLKRPRQDLIGTCFSGTVTAVGTRVTEFAEGDAIFGEAGLNFGANASHITLNASGVLMKKPDTLSHAEAATLADGALTSWNFLHHVANLERGERVLILGASGSLGTAAIQIAHALGAHVTGTCSPRNIELVRDLNADAVIDYTRTDPLKCGQSWDVIYDTLGVSPYRKARAALTKTGRYVCPVLTLPLLGAMLTSRLFGTRRAMFQATGLLPPQTLRPMLAHILTHHAKGQFTPVIDRTYPLSDLIEAHRYTDTGRKRGNVVVT